MEYIITFAALLGTTAMLGTVAVFVIKNDRILERTARIGLLGVVSAGLVLLVLGLTS